MPHNIQLIPRFPTQKGKTNASALFFVALVGIASIGAILIISGSQRMTQENIFATKPSLKTILKKEAKIEARSQEYYALKTNNVAETSIYQLNFDPSQQDELILKHNTDLRFYDTDYQNHAWLASDGGTLYVIDPTLKKIDKLVEAPEGFTISDAVFSHDKLHIAYAVDGASATTEANPDATQTGQMYVYNVATKKSVKVLERKDLGSYKVKDASRRIVLNIDAWSADDSQIIGSVNVSDLTGIPDGERFTLDLKNGNDVKKLGVTPISQNVAFVTTGTVSPDGRSIVYVDGAQLMLFDIASNKTKILHKYNANDFGPDAGKTLSVIFSTLWSDDSSRVLFSTPHGIFAVDIATRTRTPLYMYDMVGNEKSSVSLDKLGDYIMFNQPGESIPSDVLFNLKTGKLLVVPHPHSPNTTFLTFLAS